MAAKYQLTRAERKRQERAMLEVCSLSYRAKFRQLATDRIPLLEAARDACLAASVPVPPEVREGIEEATMTLECLSEMEGG